MLQYTLLAHPCTLDDLLEFNDTAQACIERWYDMMMTHSVAASTFMICKGLCACTEMLYASFGSKVRPRTSGCVAMGSALLCIVCVYGF